MYPINMTPGISMISLAIVNLYPRDENSNSNVEIFITHQVFIKIIILLNLAPFLRRTVVNGKAAYIGPAAIEAISIERNMPIRPELFPIYLINFSLGTHTSISPNKIIIGGNTEIICIKLSVALRILLYPMDLFSNDIIISKVRENTKNLYLLIIFIQVVIIISLPS